MLVANSITLGVKDVAIENTEINVNKLKNILSICLIAKLAKLDWVVRVSTNSSLENFINLMFSILTKSKDVKSLILVIIEDEA